VKQQLLLLVITCGTLSANQIMVDPQEYVSTEEAHYNVRSEDPLNDDVELLDFEFVDPNEQIDTASLNPPLWVVYLNKLTTPLFVLYNKIYKWFRVHPSARGQKVR
jgi:hypothetical protein